MSTIGRLINKIGIIYKYINTGTKRSSERESTQRAAKNRAGGSVFYDLLQQSQTALHKATKLGEVLMISLVHDRKVTTLNLHTSNKKTNK
jgi:hypothetical protein